MNAKKLACGALLAGALIGAGCGGDDDGGDGSTPGMTYFYVISELDVGRAAMDNPDVVPGFNLDGRVSDDTDAEGCYQLDYTSPPPDNEMGVDNQLGPILSSLGGAIDITGTIAENIADGSLLILAEVEDVNSTQNDNTVTVNLYLGEVPAGAMIMVDTATGRLQSGQTFDIDPLSLRADMTPLISVGGRITNGRLSAGPVDITLNLPVMDTMLALNIRKAQLRFNITETTLTGGIIGGELDIEETITAVSGLSMDVPADLVRSVLEAQADLAYDPTMMVCNAVSVGLVFNAVGAVRGQVAASTP